MNTSPYKMKIFGKNLTNSNSNQDYLNCKRELDYICAQKLEGIKIRCKCNWYDDSKKSSEENRATQNQIRLLKIGETEVKNQNKIL